MKIAQHGVPRAAFCAQCTNCMLPTLKIYSEVVFDAIETELRCTKTDAADIAKASEKPEDNISASSSMKINIMNSKSNRMDDEPEKTPVHIST